MGQKVNPIGLRLGINKTWSSKWFGRGKDYIEKLHKDLEVKKYIYKELPNAEISNVEITRYPGKVSVNIFTARPGIVIGAKGRKIDELEKGIKKVVGMNVHINIKEILVPEIDSALVARNIARQLVGRRAHRRAMKMAMQKAMESGAKGIKIICSGRLGGAEMARVESYKEGRVPLHTLRADIDYALEEANTQYGIIGVKVWVFKGEILAKNIEDDAGATLIKKK